MGEGVPLGLLAHRPDRFALNVLPVTQGEPAMTQPLKRRLQRTAVFLLAALPLGYLGLRLGW
jgi:hypothetical protein